MSQISGTVVQSIFMAVGALMTLEMWLRCYFRKEGLAAVVQLPVW